MTQTKLSVLAVFLFALIAAPIQADAKTNDDTLSGLAPVSNNDLGKYAGGSGITTNMYANATAESTSSDNSINVAGNMRTGDISNINVTGNGGLTSTITNTGNMVSISQATAVNITLH